MITARRQSVRTTLGLLEYQQVVMALQDIGIVHRGEMLRLLCIEDDEVLCLCTGSRLRLPCNAVREITAEEYEAAQ